MSSMVNENDSSSTASFGEAFGEETAFGQLVINHRLASEGQVRECLDLQRRLAQEHEYQTLSQIMVGKGYITKDQSDRLIEESERGRPKQSIPGYQILAKLGKGAMARVFKARQLNLDKVVAIKVLAKRYSQNPEYVERFYREGRAAAKLNHANIVQAFDVGEAGGYHYFVMEYVDGKTVQDHLDAKGRYPEKQALDIIIQIADALVHAHSRGLVHRDVKPKNIMITKEGIAKLADMGLAREVKDERLAQSEAGRAFGTPYYISPEQIRGEVKIDFRADIYSLGATFYHMVTGQVPFDANTPTAVMIKHLREQLTPPDHINPELSIGCAEIVEVMMAKDRKDRYQSTADLLEDLRAVRDGGPPIHARAAFNVSQLAGLEENGVPIETSVVRVSEPTAELANWKLAALILACLLFLSIVLNMVLLMHGG